MLSETDRAHLKTLSICWYILAGLQVVGGLLFGVIYALVGVAMMLDEDVHNPKGMRAAGIILIIVSVFVVLLVLGMALLSFLTAQGLGRQKRRVLIYIMASLACLSVPLGTLLGVFTFVIMGRPAVKQAFEANTA